MVSKSSRTNITIHPSASRQTAWAEFKVFVSRAGCILTTNNSEASQTRKYPPLLSKSSALLFVVIQPSK